MKSPGSTDPVTSSRTKGKPDVGVSGITPLFFYFSLHASAKYWKRTMPSSTSKLVFFWRRRSQNGSSRPGNPNSRFTPVKGSTPPSQPSGFTETPIPSNETATSTLHPADGSEHPITPVDDSTPPARVSVVIEACTIRRDTPTTESDSEDGLKKWFDDGGLEHSKFVSQILHARGYPR